MDRWRISWMTIVGAVGVVLSVVSLVANASDWWIYLLIAGAFFLLDARRQKRIASEERRGPPD